MEDITRNELGDCPFKELQSQPSGVLLSVDALNIVSSLSDKSLQLLMYIIGRIDPSTEYLLLDRKQYKLDTGIRSDTTVSSAITELSRKGFIRSTLVRGYYWINNSLFTAI